MRGKNVRTIAFAQDGSVWVGTTQGLFKLNPLNGQLLGQVPNLPSSRILSIAPDTGHKVWVGTSEGLGWVSQTTGEGNAHLGFVSPVVREARGY
jgi:ligand-binding sensor domain-containing protein